MNSSRISTGYSAVDLPARPASGSDPARARGAAFEAMLGAAFMSPPEPPFKAAPVAPPPDASLRDDRVGDGDRSGEERDESVPRETASARDDTEVQKPPCPKTSRKAADDMNGVLRPLVRSLASRG
ncbi:MAG: hypothetical protein ABI647_06930, partial [Gemmatimonadota bacterium]